MIDSMVMTAALFPETMEEVFPANCAVELAGTETRGYFRIDRSGQTGREPNAAVCTRMHAGAYKEHLLFLLGGNRDE